MGAKKKAVPKAAGTGTGTGTGTGRGKKKKEGEEARKFPRVPLEILVQVTSESIAQFRQVHARNLSVGGMFIETTSPRAVGASVFFQFTVKDGGTLIEGLARVVHAAPHGMGIEFVSVLEPSASIIRKLVADRLASSPQ
jgi:Tfp pilus assembly protein PilZ